MGRSHNLSAKVVLLAAVLAGAAGSLGGTAHYEGTAASRAAEWTARGPEVAAPPIANGVYGVLKKGPHAQKTKKKRQVLR